MIACVVKIIINVIPSISICMYLRCGNTDNEHLLNQLLE